MTKLNVGDYVRVLPNQGFEDLKDGSIHEVVLVNINDTVRLAATGYSNWRVSRFELVKSPKTDEYLTSLEAFKAKAVRAYPDLDDDPDMAEAVKIFDKYMGDNDTPAQVYFKDAIKLGRKLEKEGK